MRSQNEPALNLAWRILAIVVAVGLWFWTQSLIGARSPSVGITDVPHDLLAPLNSYFSQHATAANALLIASSAFVDFLGLFLIAEWVFAGRSRAFLGLVLLLALRQVMQALCALPPPPNMIWRYPGFPSLFVTYQVAYDYFFSGHTAIAVFGATEVVRLKRPWLTAFAIVIVCFEVIVVLILRAHYTMDVFTGVIAALWIARVCEFIGPKLDQVLMRSNA